MPLRHLPASTFISSGLSAWYTDREPMPHRGLTITGQDRLPFPAALSASSMASQDAGTGIPASFSTVNVFHLSLQISTASGSAVTTRVPTAANRALFAASTGTSISNSGTSRPMASFLQYSSKKEIYPLS